MSDKPILFSSPMIKALLDGRKTQTRRVAKFVKENAAGKFNVSNPHGGVAGATEDEVRSYGPDYAPWAVGDRLWVRESWTHDSDGVWTIANARMAGPGGVHYRADGDAPYLKWFPSIHMPREFSRITLLVKDVRVQRLQEISDEDVEAEGACGAFHDFDCVGGYYPDPAGYCVNGCGGDSYKDVFARLWRSINGAGSWEANPFVAVISFSVILANIDAPNSAEKSDG